jgi:hypothetical protein
MVNHCTVLRDMEVSTSRPTQADQAPEKYTIQFHIDFKNNALPLLTPNNFVVLKSRTFQQVSSFLTIDITNLLS